MAKFCLTEEQRRLLRGQLCSTYDLDFYRRTQALLEVDKGRSPAEVARSLGVSCSSIYNWMGAFAQNPQLDAVMDHRGQGRRSLWTDPLNALLCETLKQAPNILGYQSKGWTVPLLQGHLERHGGKLFSNSTIRRKLRECGCVWRQFGFILPEETGLNGEAVNRLASHAIAPNGHAVAQCQQTTAL